MNDFSAANGPIEGATIGLRIDVDTWRGTKIGVPQLCRVLKARGIRGTFFFSAGPDNMGRHLWRLLKPQFLLKMLRSNAPGLYGWDILLRGTLWRGPLIAQGLPKPIAQAARDGHEIGMHAWDHHAWQQRIEGAEKPLIDRWTRRAVQSLKRATGQTPMCAATPGWRTTDKVLWSRDEFGFRFASDCRGTHIFRPVVKGRELKTPQIPNTLPTYDEVIGRDGINDANYNEFLISQIHPGALNVLTIHAEVEGIARAALFEEFLDLAASRGIGFVPLGSLLPAPQDIPRGKIVREDIKGREGWVGVQA